MSSWWGSGLFIKLSATCFKPFLCCQASFERNKQTWKFNDWRTLSAFSFLWYYLSVCVKRQQGENRWLRLTNCIHSWMKNCETKQKLDGKMSSQCWQICFVILRCRFSSTKPRQEVESDSSSSASLSVIQFFNFSCMSDKFSRTSVAAQMNRLSLLTRLKSMIAKQL